MFKRLHHQHISQALNLLNSELLQEAECYFAGGTAITLLLEEYRESVDIDFLCASKYGYRLLRNTVSPNTDRGLDKSTASRDIIDIAMMIHHWGSIPLEAWSKAEEAYGGTVAKAFHASLLLIQDENYLRQCLKKMNMADELIQTIYSALSRQNLSKS